MQVGGVYHFLPFVLHYYAFQFFATDTTQSAEMIRRFIFQHEIVTRYLRINILDYEGAPCLKMEIIGCPKRGNYVSIFS